MKKILFRGKESVKKVVTNFEKKVLGRKCKSKWDEGEENQAIKILKFRTLKADSHIACRSHAAPMPFPCHAVPLRV